MKTLYLILISVVISGCAGLHTMPPNDYSKTRDAHTLRVFFDQEGDIYPESPTALMPKQKTFGRDQGFSIRSHMKKTNQTYNQDIINSRYRQIIRKIEANRNLKLVFLIHGYNNSYDEARQSFDQIKNFLVGRQGKEFLFVEVYWDGLYKGPFSSPAPLAYWFDSMTYSNIAGQVGLRKIINRLPSNTDLTLITHSRGAGVAFSAFSDPVYDKNIAVPSYEKLKGSNLKAVNIVSIAPAIGNGHPVGDLGVVLPKRSNVFIGFNPNDPALNKSQSKIKVGSSKFGDTSLGTDNEFFISSERSANQSGLTLKRVIYKNYSEHGLSGYLNSTQETECLFWAAGLISAKPKNCTIE